MARVNEQFLRHSGSTDVITFDHRDPDTPAESVSGEIFVSLDDAVEQAGRFRASWQSELTRYVVHGLLHLKGFTDRNPAGRKRMKREENRLLALAARRFPLASLASSSNPPRRQAQPR
jgi:rRNA maturation RNase YbeY